MIVETHSVTDRHHVYVKTSHREVQLAEVGPRFEMRREWSRSVAFLRSNGNADGHSRHSLRDQAGHDRAS